MPRNLGLEDAIPLGLADAARCRAGLGLFAAIVAGSRNASEKLFYRRLHCGIHLDESELARVEAGVAARLHLKRGTGRSR